MQNIINQNERIKTQNKSLQQENRILREKLINAAKAFRAILNGSLPCDASGCTLERDCFDEPTDYGDTCMIRLAQKGLKELE